VTELSYKRRAKNLRNRNGKKIEEKKAESLRKKELVEVWGMIQTKSLQKPFSGDLSGAIRIAIGSCGLLPPKRTEGRGGNTP